MKKILILAILLILLAAPVLAVEIKGTPNEHSYGNVPFNAYMTQQCSQDSYGYSEVGFSVQACPYYHGLSWAAHF